MTIKQTLIKLQLFTLHILENTNEKLLSAFETIIQYQWQNNKNITKACA